MEKRDMANSKGFPGDGSAQFLEREARRAAERDQLLFLGGDFGGYGEQFLDRLNDAVNGPNSTKPITITIGPLQLWKSGLSGFSTGILVGFLYNLNLVLYFVLWFAGIAAIGVIIVYRTWWKRCENANS